MAIWWRDWAVVPILNLLSGASARLSFSCAEWVLPALFYALLALCKRRAARALLCLCLVPVLLWCSLFFCAAETPVSSADAQTLENMCAALVDRLNARPLAFSGSTSDDSRVKTANFPFWMRLMNISGIFIPITGEILISPNAAPAALPFTIVHEKMHLRGIADEGEANIAAYRECRAAGGEAADSADLWALGYGLRALKRKDAAACARIDAQMQPHLRRALRFFDVNAAPSDYENLSFYLAANPAYWYNDTIPTTENVIA